jgi:hypothetical protein
LHIKRINVWLNNTNPWILLASRCNCDLKFIKTSNKNSKSLFYYITKISIYTTHMYSFLQISIKFFETINNNTNLYDLINKSHHLLIWHLHTIGSQQEISTTKAIIYLLNLPYHITNYDFTYIPWYSLLTWVNEQEIKWMNQNKMIIS